MYGDVRECTVMAATGMYGDGSKGHHCIKHVELWSWMELERRRGGGEHWGLQDERDAGGFAPQPLPHSHRTILLPPLPAPSVLPPPLQQTPPSCCCGHLPTSNLSSQLLQFHSCSTPQSPLAPQTSLLPHPPCPP